MKQEYIIVRNTKEFGFCLFRTIGQATEAEAERILERVKKDYPNEELKLKVVEEKDCWWKQGGLD